MKIARSVILGLVLVLGQATGGARAAGLACDDDVSVCLIREAEGIAASLENSRDRDEAIFSIAAALAALGRLDDAMDATDRIEDPMTQAEALGEISGAAARRGDFAVAHRIALGILDARYKSSRVMALERLAVEQAAAGEIDAAFETVVAIDNPYRRSEAQAAIATSVARAGDIPGAIRTASRIATEYWFISDQNQNKVASGLVSRSGEFDHFWFYEALANIAAIQARNGDITGALKTAKSIPDIAGRSRATNRVAIVQAENGDPGGALETASRIEIAYGDLAALIAVADSMAAGGDVDGALDLSQDIAAAYGDVSGLVAVAVQQARRGDVAASFETARAIDNAEGRERAFAGIARELARGGRLDQALTALGETTDASGYSDSIESITVILAHSGRADQALDFASDFANPRAYGDLVIAVALVRAGAGDPEGAIDTALHLEDEMLRAIAFAEIARVVH